MTKSNNSVSDEKSHSEPKGKTTYKYKTNGPTGDLETIEFHAETFEDFVEGRRNIWNLIFGGPPPTLK